MTMIALAVALCVTTPFEDVHGRFTIDLPRGWTFAPQPGDTGGAYFRRKAEGLIGNATVRVVPFTVAVTLDGFAARVAAASDQEPGFRLLQNEPTTVAGFPGIRRKFVVSINGDASFTKMVEQRIVLINMIGYVIHAETMAVSYGTFESDFAKLFASFRPGGHRQTPSGRVSRRDARPLFGRWEGGGHSVQLSPAGVVIIDGLQGTYRVDGGVLMLRLANEQRIYEYDVEGDTLRLSGGVFGDGQRFHRMHGNPAAGD